MSDHEWIPASVFLESVRRAVPGSMPIWTFMHDAMEWQEGAPADPLPVDPRVSFRLVSAEQSVPGDDEVLISLELLHNSGRAATD